MNDSLQANSRIKRVYGRTEFLIGASEQWTDISPFSFCRCTKDDTFFLGKLTLIRRDKSLLFTVPEVRLSSIPFEATMTSLSLYSSGNGKARTPVGGLSTEKFKISTIDRFIKLAVHPAKISTILEFVWDFEIRPYTKESC
jgi:hypothetical protein